MSAKEAELARFRGLLEQEHGNDHDKSYTYVCPVTGESVPLTPLMMKEWARALVRISHLSEMLLLIQDLTARRPNDGQNASQHAKF